MQAIVIVRREFTVFQGILTYVVYGSGTGLKYLGGLYAIKFIGRPTFSNPPSYLHDARNIGTVKPYTTQTSPSWGRVRVLLLIHLHITAATGKDRLLILGQREICVLC